MNDHVTKPIDPDALFAALKRWARPQSKNSASPEIRPVTTVIQDPAALPVIEGVDIEGGLRRVAGNKRLYRSLLEQFASKQANAAEEISVALGEGNQVLARSLAHTVKGLAGNLGISPVQLTAEKIERSLREGETAAPSLLDEFRSTLSGVVKAIQAALTGTSAPAVQTQKPFHLEAAAAAGLKLRDLINANDGAAAEALTQFEQALAGTGDRPQIEALRSAIQDFDFDAALARLDEITARFSKAENSPSQ
jgi:HPt (histidine-containing phosphotransfer) domain-containing protein